MLHARQQKCKSSSKNLTSHELEGSPFINKTPITACKPIEQSYKKLATIGLIGKGDLSRELFRENKENLQPKKDEKDNTVSSNSEYIRSLYRKYLGKDELDRNIKTDVKELTNPLARDLQRNPSSSNQRMDTQQKTQRAREKDSKRESTLPSQRNTDAYPPTISKSFSKKESYEQRHRKDQRTPYDQSSLLLQMADSEDSCIRTMKILRQAARRFAVY